MARSEKKGNAASTPDDPWRSGRSRFGLHQFRRGPDKRWRFAGQERDEVVRMVVRQHWWLLVLPGLPFLGSVVLLFVVLWAAESLPWFAAFSSIAEVIAVLLMIGTGIWFAYRDLLVWWFETYIITNKRIINSAGLFQPKRMEIPIEKVQQVGIYFKDSPLGFILGFGTVHVYLVGGDLVMKNVPDPRKVKDAIQGLSDVVRAKKKPEAEAPKPIDPDLVATLDDLAKGKPVPKLPDADEDYPPPRDLDRVRGPRRTFGGFLRIPADIRYFSGEYTVKYLQRSQYVLLRNLVLPVLVLVLVLPVAVITPTVGYVPINVLQVWWFVAGLTVLGILLWMATIYILYIDDIYILTNRRIIDIERELIFNFESRLEVEYKNIRDIQVKVSNVIERFLDIGNVYIQTPGSSPDIIFHTVDHPFIIQDLVLGIKNHKENEDKVKKENEEKKTLQLWFGTLFSKLEETTASRSAPDLRDKDLLSAMYCAQELELGVEVFSEVVPPTDMKPGQVIHQSPPPGTLMTKGGRIEVVLSRRPTAVDQI